MRFASPLMLAAAALLVPFAAPAAAQTAMAGTANQWVRSADGTQIAYRVAGKGDATLVLIHGWSCDSSYWDAQLPAFTSDHRVVAIDLAGHGASGLDRKQWTIEAFGQDVAAVVRKLRAKRVVLVGHSMGGPVALEAARLLGDRVIGVIGVDTLADLGGGGMDAATKQGFLAALRKDMPGTTRSVVETFMFRKDADWSLKKRIVDDMASAPPQVAIGAMESLLAYDPKPAAAELDLRIVAINADAQPPMNEAAARKIVPGFRLVTVPNTAHFLHMEAPDRFNPLLRQEIERIRSNVR